MIFSDISVIILFTSLYGHISVIIIAVNIYSTKVGVYLQNVFTALKLGAVAVLVIMGFYTMCIGQHFIPLVK